MSGKNEISCTNDDSGNILLFFQTESDFDSAFQKCVDYDAALLTISGEDENVFVSEEAKKVCQHSELII
jgi:hypothetical protein